MQEEVCVLQELPGHLLLPSQRKHLSRLQGLRSVLFTQEGKVSLEVVQVELYGFDICQRLQEQHVHHQLQVSSSQRCRQEQGRSLTRGGQTFFWPGEGL